MAASFAFMFGTFIGAYFGMFLMCLMQMADHRDDKSECTGECNQGRNCTCKPR